MSWARYDDELPMNQKVGRLIGRGQAGLAALGLHLLANTWSRHNGTAGVIEKHVPNLLVGPQGRKLARILTDVGMFDARDDGGWEIHDFAEFHDPSDPEPNKSAADRKKELSEVRAAAGRKGGLAKASKQTPSKASDLLEAKGVAKGVAKPWQCSSPVPVPVPSNHSSYEEHPSSPADARGRGIEIDDIVQEAAKRYARTEAQNGSAKSEAGLARWKAKQLTDERTPAIRQALEQYPDAPVSALADHALGLPRALDAYRPTGPPDEPEGPRLTPDQIRQLVTPTPEDT